MTDILSKQSTAPSATTRPASAVDDSHCFIVEWFDAAANLARKYQLTYHTADASLELYDIKNKKLFLKRAVIPTITVASLFVGSQLTIYSRTMKVIGYGDESTRNRIENNNANFLLLVKPAATRHLGALLSLLHSQSLKLVKVKSVKLNATQAKQFYGESTQTPRVTELLAGSVIVVELIGKLNQSSLLAGISAITGPQSQSVVFANSERSHSEEMEFLLHSSINNSALYQATNNVTLMLIKPHAVNSGDAGAILTKVIDSGFNINAVESFYLTREASEEFLEVYKGVVNEFPAWVEELTNGLCLAVECTLTGSGSESAGVSDSNGSEEKESLSQSTSNPSVSAMRQLAGPFDPEIARHLRPQSLRALFGKNKVKNAVHITDLPEDAPLEAEFFFSILQQQKQ